MYVQKFEDLNKSDIAIAGGKGANLGELTQAGIPVPPGFVVTAQAYKYFMDEAGINDQVMEILDVAARRNLKMVLATKSSQRVQDAEKEILAGDASAMPAENQ